MTELNLRRTSRPLFMVLWLCLLLIGCIAQIQTLPSATGGAGAAVQFVKRPIHGDATLTPNSNGTSHLLVALAPIGADKVAGRFRTKDVVLSKINVIVASISATDIATPIVPTQADASGHINVTNGVIPALTFPSIPPGKGRILTVQGFHGATPVKGALIRSLFDTGGSSTFEVSPATTPAAKVYQSLSGTVASALTASQVNTLLNTMMGVSGGYPHTYTTNPALLNTASLDSTLNSGTSIGAVNTSAYAEVGADVTFSFYMDPNGVMVAGDQPTAFCEDPATDPVPIPDHKAGTAPLNINTATIALAIASDNLVTITFKSVAAADDGLPWEVGTALPDDQTATPNPKYYAAIDDAADPQCGHTGFVTVAPADAAAGTALTPSFDYPPLDPHYVAGQMRWRDSSVAFAKAVDLYPSLATSLSGTVASSGSGDFHIFVGPTTATIPTYTLASLSLPAAKPIEFDGLPNIPEGQRPTLSFATTATVTLNQMAQCLRDLRVHGASVNLMAGGNLQRVTVDGVRGNAMAVDGILASVAAASLDQVHVYDVRNQSSTPGASVAGIACRNGGTITNCLIDDNYGVGGTASVRMEDGGPGGMSAFGIFLGSAAASVQGTNVIRIGHLGTVATGATDGVTGIFSTGPATVTGSTVSDVQGWTAADGIKLAAGSVQNCEVRNINHDEAYIGGIRVAATDTGAVSGNYVHDLVSTYGGSTVNGLDIGMSNAADVTVTNNSCAALSATSTTGIDVFGNTSHNLNLSNNRINGCGTDGTPGAGFQGVITQSYPNCGVATVQDNDVTGNSVAGAFNGVLVQLANGNVVCNHNRLASNQLSMPAAATGSCVWQLVVAETGSGSQATISNNLLQNNALAAAAAGAAAHLDGIHASPGNDFTVSVINNLVSGNVYTDTTGGSSKAFWLVVGSAGSGTIRSNRIVGNTSTTTHLTAAIQLNPSSSTFACDHNLVSQADLGGSGNHALVSVIGGGTVTFTHNSLYAGATYVPLIDATGGVITCALVDNVLASGAASASSTAALGVGNGCIGTVDHNTLYPWTTSAYDGGTSAHGTGERTAPGNPFSDLMLLTLGAGEVPPSVQSSDSLERGAYGGGVLQTAPVFP